MFFRTTTTLGVRAYEVQRAVLPRDVVEVSVRGTTVRVKRGYFGDQVVTMMPEHADIDQGAEQSAQPARQIWIEAMVALLREREAQDQG
jgi:uncharacterized protein (DUF111 family)